MTSTSRTKFSSLHSTAILLYVTTTFQWTSCYSSVSPSVNTRLWLPGCLSEAGWTWVQRDQLIIPVPLQALAEQIKAWHWFEITSPLVWPVNPSKPSHKPVALRSKNWAVCVVRRAGVSSEKSWDPFIIRLSTAPVHAAKITPIVSLS